MTSITGYHAIEAALLRGSGSTLLVARSSPRIERLAALAARGGVRVQRAAAKELERYAPRERHRGLVLLAAEEAQAPLTVAGLVEAAGPRSLLVLLDGVTDPRNLGAVIRSADLFAAEAVITTHHRSAGETQAVRTTSAGAVEWVPLVSVSNLARAMESLKAGRFWIYGAEPGGRDPAEVDLSGPVALVLGAEGPGLRRLVRESCDGLLGIPASGHVGSFNVSVAAAILMYEVRRQQRAAGSRKG